MVSWISTSVLVLAAVLLHTYTKKISLSLIHTKCNPTLATVNNGVFPKGCFLNSTPSYPVSAKLYDPKPESHVHCWGVSSSDRDIKLNWKTKTCVYHNICYSGESQQWNLFLREPSSTEHTVGIRGRHDAPSLWHPGVVKGDYTGLVYFSQIEHAYLLRRVDPANAGHLLLETMWPLFTLMLMVETDLLSLGGQDHKNRLIVLDDFCSTRSSAFFGVAMDSPETDFKNRCTRNTASFLQPFSRYELMDTRALSKMAGNGIWCIPHLVAGSSYMGPWSDTGFYNTPIIGSIHRQFKYWWYGIHCLQLKQAKNIDRPLAVLLIKNGRRSLANVVDLKEHVGNLSLRDKLNFVSFDLSETNQIQQLKYFSRTVILISVAGSAAQSQFFLPDGSAFISFPFCGGCGKHDLYKYGCRGEIPFWSTTPHRQIFPYVAELSETVPVGGTLHLQVNLKKFDLLWEAAYRYVFQFHRYAVPMQEWSH
eukprot:312127-Hanusia_phi.AAC.1